MCENRTEDRSADKRDSMQTSLENEASAGMRRVTLDVCFAENLGPRSRKPKRKPASGFKGNASVATDF